MAHEATTLTPQRRAWQRYFAEFLGTFALVFLGCGAAISNHASNGEVSSVGVALTFGFVVSSAVYALGPISSAHLNPAVTIAFAFARRFPVHCVPAYIAAQSAGAVTASLLHGFVYGHQALGAAYGATVPSVPTMPATCFEILLTFILMLVIMAVATDRHIPGAVPGLAIGLTVVACALCGGGTTGASMNPARSLGPALLTGGKAWQTLPIYLIGPTIGAILGAFCYQLLRDGTLNLHPAPTNLEEALRSKPGLSRHGLTHSDSRD